jgi:N-acyl-D-amino-acid deacylase
MTLTANTKRVLRGGTVLDGSGADGKRADVLVEGGRIRAVTELDALDAPEVDVSGLYVAPGFIDIHSHSDYTLLADPRALSSIHQGVTTEVVGNCGFGCFPVTNPDLAKASIYGYVDDPGIAWSSAAGYFDRLEEAAPAVNVLSLVPNAQLRISHMEQPSNRARKDEVRAMRKALEEALEAGAWGYSTGLEYPVEQRATEDEIVELCTAVAEVDGLYATHVRRRDSEGEAAVAEAVTTARRAGVRLQVSHLLPRAGYELGVRCIELAETARAEGVDVAFDQHTRRHGFTHLHTALPAWAFEGGSDLLRQRLTTPDTRSRMSTYRGLLGSDWSRVRLAANPVWPEHANRDIAEIGSLRGQPPTEAVYDLLLEGFDVRHQLFVTIPCHSERQQRETFAHDLCMPASDATALGPDGPLASSSFHGAYTWASWYYRFMVRETALLSPAAAVRKLTAVPAERLGLRDRGHIRAGMRADLVAFDPDRFADRGTTEEPNRLATGMVHVLVNGEPTLRDGEPTGARAGQALRRNG